MTTGSSGFIYRPKKQGDHDGLGFGKYLDFIRVSGLRKIKLRQTKVAVIKNSSSLGSETVELEPASAGSLYLVPIQKYCDSTHKTVRRKTGIVMVGNVALGSEHPIRIQTMTDHNRYKGCCCNC